MPCFPSPGHSGVMKICINLYPIRPNVAGGIESFCRWVCQIPAHHTTQHEFFVLLPQGSGTIEESLPRSLDWDPFSSALAPTSSSSESGFLRRVSRHRLFPGLGRAVWRAVRAVVLRVANRLLNANIGLSDNRNRKHWLSKSGFDIVHCPYQVTDPLPPHTADVPYVINLHDLQHEHFPQFFSNEEKPWGLAWRRQFYARSAKAARCIVVALEQVKQDIIRFCDVNAEKVRVIRPPRPFEGLPPVSEDEKNQVKSKYRLPDTFAFYPAMMWEHKNHIRLLQAMKQIAQRNKPVHLVCTGTPGPFSSQVMAKIEELGLTEYVHVLGYVQYSELRAIYALGEFFIFPSLYEGIGMPVYEALAMGCPAACSNIVGFSDVLGDAGLIFDPSEVDEIADAMYRLATEPELRAKFKEEGPKRLEGYSWKRFAQEYVEAYEFATGKDMVS